MKLNSLTPGRHPEGARRPLRLLVATVLVAGFAGIGVSSFTGVANADGENIRICHAGNSDTNPYQHNPPDDGSKIVNGHGSHDGPPWDPTLKDKKIQWGDIIPPFTYVENGVTKTYPGKNWTTAGQEIHGNGCAPVFPDLRLLKTSSGAAPAGTSGNYSISVTNIGNGTATGPLSVTDSLPTGVLATAATGTGWACTLSGGGASVSCTHAGSLAPGASAGVITVSVNWVTAGTKNNSASVGAVFGETATANNTGTNTTVISAALIPDLELTKTSSGTAAAGTTGSYFVDVRNIGTGTANGTFTVTDTLPAGVVATGATGTGWVCTVPLGGGSFSCDHAGNLAAGTSAGQIDVDVNWVTAGTKLNSATVSTVTGETATTNNTEGDSTVITAALVPDLELTKTSSGTAVAGTTGSYLVDVRNIGTGTANGPFTVSDAMPAGVVATAATGTGWVCSVGGGGASVSCTHGGDLASGASAGSITLSVTWSTAGSKTNSATVGAVADETAVNNNTGSNVTVVTPTPTPDLQLTKAGPANRTTGQTGDYVLVVENVGTAAATGQITVTDTLPGGVNVTGPIVSGGFTCTVASNVVTCVTDDDVAVNGTKTITLPASFTSSGNKANTASVAVVGDPNVANNSSVANTVVTDPAGPPPPVVPPLPADLAVQKTGPASVAPGDTVTWTVTVTNKGPGNAAGFSVTDTLPSGVTLTSLTGNGFTCTATTGVCTFTSVLLPGAAAVVTVVGALAQDVTGTSLANVVVVGPSDATPADNTDTLVSAIEQPQPAPADLVLQKSAPAAPTVPGGSIAWTITVTNAGGSDASGFTVTDELADGLTFSSAEGAGFDCSDSAPVSCSYSGTLAAGETATLVVTTGLITDWRFSSVQNAAEVELANDPTPENNRDSATAGVALPIGGGDTDAGSGGTPSPAASPLPSKLPFTDEEPAAGPTTLPFTGSATDMLLGLGAGLSVIGLMLALTGRRRRAVE